MTSNARVYTDENGWEHTTYPSGITTSTPPDLLRQGIHRVERRLDKIEDLLRFLTSSVAQPRSQDQLTREHVMPVTGDLDDQRPETLPGSGSTEIDDNCSSHVLEGQPVDRQVERDGDEINAGGHEPTVDPSGAVTS